MFAVRGILARPDLRETLHAVQYFGSHTDSEGAPPFVSPAARSSLGQRSAATHKS